MKSFLSRRVKNAAIECVESLEARCLLSVTSLGTVPSQQVNPDGTATTINLGTFLNDPQLTGGTVIEMQTPEGNIPLQLTDSKTPLTVANFEKYIANLAYDPTVVSRASPGFVIQGGGTKPDGSNNASVGTLQSEAGISNTTGTIAMALSAFPGTSQTDPNSATNQWFINLGNNTSLDSSSNGPFTVFGNVIDAGLSIANTIAALPTLDAHTENGQWGLGAQLGNLPVINYTGPSPLPNGGTVPQANLVTDNIVQIPAGQAVTYTASVADPSIMTGSISNGVLSLAIAPGVTSGQTMVTVTATDLSGQSVSQTFAASVTNGSLANVTLGVGGAKSVSYLDTDGTNAVLTLKGAGTAVVHFAGTDLNPVLTRHNTIILSSTTASIAGIDFTNTNATSAFTITTKGGTRAINVGTISTAAIRSISGKGVTLTGDVNASGAIGMLSVAGAQGGTINAPALGTVAVAAGFSDNLTVGGSAVSIGKFSAGSINGGTWSISGTAKSVGAGTATGWSPTFSAVTTLSTKGDLGGTINAASIKTLNVGGNLTATVNTGSISSMTVRGNVSNTTVTTTAAGVDLARVSVLGAITSSTFNATGSIGNVMARELDSSHIYAGLSSNVGAGQPLPNMITDFLTNQSIASVRLKTIRTGVSFSNSDIAAGTIGRVFLGTLLTSNGGQVTGVAAQSLGQFNAIADGKVTVLKNLPSTVNFEDFIIKLF